MLFETSASTIKNSNDQARKLAREFLNMQSFSYKKIINKEKLYIKEKCAEYENSRKEL